MRSRRVVTKEKNAFHRDLKARVEKWVKMLRNTPEVSLTHCSQADLRYL